MPKNWLGRALSVSAVVYGSAAVLAILSQVIMARIMGAMDYGVYYYALSWIVILALFVRIGFDYVILRFLPVFIHRDEWSLARGLLSFSSRIILINGFILGSLMIGLVILLGDRIESTASQTFIISAPCLFIFGAIYLRQAVLRSLRHVVRSLVPDGIIAPVLLIILSVTIWGAGYDLTAPVAMGLTVIAFAVSLVIGAYWQAVTVPEEVNVAKPNFDRKVWTGIAFSMLIINGMNIILVNIDVIILGLFRAPDEVGIYGISAKTATIAAFPLTIANAVFSPLIAKYFFSNEKQKLQQTIVLGMRLVSLVSIIMLLLGISMSSWVLSFFGDEFTRGESSLRLLVIAQCINALCGPVGLLLALCGYEKDVARVMMVAVFASVTLNFILAPVWGMEGAALATAACIVLWNVTLYLKVRSKLALDASGWIPVRRVGA